MSNDFAYLASADLTDVGRRRKNNEDSLLRMPACGLFCVADGMGGVQGGEVASKATVDALRDTFERSTEALYAVTATAGARLIERAVNRASQWIKARSDERGMVGTGSTVVTLFFDRVTPSRATILHAGDSRAYRFRADKLVQLTKDHSVAAAAGLADDKNLPAMFRGVITRAVGLENRVQLEETPVDVRPNDIFLLCSDGLDKMISDRCLQKLFRKHCRDEIQVLASLLIDEALKAGGEDNVSVIVVRVADTLPDAPTMEVSELTRLLEQAPLPPEPGVAAVADEERETGQTVDSAKLEGDGVTPPEMASPFSTPTTPISAARVPSPSGATAATTAETEEEELRTSTVEVASPAKRRMTLLLALLGVLGIAGAAAVWIFVFKK